MLSDEWLPRYRLLENFNIKWNGNGNAYDRGDYNSSFALRAVELKSRFSHNAAHIFTIKEAKIKALISLCRCEADLRLEFFCIYKKQVFFVSKLL